MIYEVGTLETRVWRCDKCGNEMQGEDRPKRCTKAECRKVADWVEGIKRGPKKSEPLTINR